jgi:hypothetical protein
MHFVGSLFNKFFEFILAIEKEAYFSTLVENIPLFCSES